MPYASASGSKSVSVYAVSVSISADRSAAKVGDTVTFTVTVTQDSAARAGDYVYVQIYIPEKNAWVTIGTGTTGSDGKATVRWTVPWSVTVDSYEAKLPCSRFSFRAYDYTLGMASGNTVSIDIVHPTRLTVSTDKDAYLPGQTVTVTVKLEYNYKDTWYPLGGASVTISAFGTTRTVTTGGDGTASTTFTAPSQSGTYTITATYAGLLGLTARAAALLQVLTQPLDLVPIAAPLAAGLAMLAVVGRLR